ncbi:hypothetical protein L3Q82_005879 [Scortum barcoo]|uniref:Uncharacterized protein n=1 Tax=Scortum barcoo TaxID=214431 RepID=A0ACB8V6S4_9TELE|nr:hypothetical protein L3Q82_005879 [Scortum barcoo]
MSHREEASGKTQDTLERLCLSAGLGIASGPPGRAGGSVWDINTYTDVVIGYIGKCIDDVVPRITVQTFPNQKPWVNGEVCAKLKARTDAYNSGDLEEYRKSRYALRRAISSAKRQYRDKVESHYKGLQHQEHVDQD